MPEDTEIVLLRQILETLQEIREAIKDNEKTLSEILSVMPRDVR